MHHRLAYRASWCRPEKTDGATGRTGRCIPPPPPQLPVPEAATAVSAFDLLLAYLPSPERLPCIIASGTVPRAGRRRQMWRPPPTIQVKASAAIPYYCPCHPSSLIYLRLPWLLPFKHKATPASQDCLPSLTKDARRSLRLLGLPSGYYWAVGLLNPPRDAMIPSRMCPYAPIIVSCRCWGAVCAVCSYFLYHHHCYSYTSPFLFFNPFFVYYNRSTPASQPGFPRLFAAQPI